MDAAAPHQAFIAAGLPAGDVGFYPTEVHDRLGEIRKLAGRALIFWRQSTTERYATNPRHPNPLAGYRPMPDRLRMTSSDGPELLRYGRVHFRQPAAQLLNASADCRAEIWRGISPSGPGPTGSVARSRSASAAVENARLFSACPIPKIGVSMTPAIEQDLKNSCAARLNGQLPQRPAQASKEESEEKKHAV